MVLVVILHSLLILFLVYKLYQKIGKGPISRFYYPAIFFKISAGIGIGWLYLYHYQLGDTLLYHHAASYLADQALAEPQIYLKAIFNQEGAIINGNSEFVNQPRAFLTVKILSVIHIITYKNYWLSTIYFSLFSFYGFWMLTTKLVRIYPKLTYAAIIAFLFFPSVVFWSSGITKESLSLGAMTFLVAYLLGFIKLQKRFNLKDLIWIVALILLLVNLKYYYAILFLPALFAVIFTGLLVRKFPRFKSKRYWEISIWMLTFIIIAMIGSLMHYNLIYDNLYGVIVANHDSYYDHSRSDNLIRFNQLKPEISSFMENFPLAVFSGIFRPLIFEGGNFLKVIAGIENLLLLIMSVISLNRLKNIFRSDDRILMLTIVLYTVVLAGFLALSTPNLGTLFRYKIGFLPFFVYLVLSEGTLLGMLGLYSRKNNK